tara:strand:- start:2519 stop:2653 length:135 start_codon:yes stop_codon:yes gene_type:complete
LSLGYGGLINEGQINFSPEIDIGLKIAETVASPIILKVATGSYS